MFLEIYTCIRDLHRWHYVVIVSIGYFCYYIRRVVQRPMLAISDGPFRDYLALHVPMLRRKFWPTFWCVESRAQTVMASIVRGKILPRLEYKREILTLSDGGEVALDWMDGGCPENSPIVLILPGLTGESQAEYIKCLVLAANSNGIRTVVFNNRGQGGMTLKTRRLYCAASYEDLSEVIKYVRTAHPDSKLGATGISMGGLILGNYLAVHSEEARQALTATQIISVPWNVVAGCASIEKPYLNNLLGQHLVRSLCATLERCEIFKADTDYDMEKIRQSKTIKEFDSHFTSKHFGFDDVDHYYASASLHDKLHLISVPCLCLSAADDPFQPLEAIPIENAENSTHVAIVITARGGHIGFLEGCWPNPKDQYMARLFLEYFGAALRCDTFAQTSAQMLAAFHVKQQLRQQQQQQQQQQQEPEQQQHPQSQ